MKNEHKIEYASKTREDMKPKHGTQQTLKSLFHTKDGAPLSEVTKCQIDSAVEGYIIDSLRPLSTVEQTSFKTLLQTLEIGNQKFLKGSTHQRLFLEA